MEKTLCCKKSKLKLIQLEQKDQTTSVDLLSNISPSSNDSQHGNEQQRVVQRFVTEKLGAAKRCATVCCCHPLSERSDSPPQNLDAECDRGVEKV